MAWHDDCEKKDEASAFVEKVMEQIHFPENRGAIEAELREHIEDHMEALERNGLDETLAMEQSVAAMGDAKQIGKALNRVDHFLLRWSFRAMLFIMLVIGMLGVFLIGEAAIHEVRYASTAADAKGDILSQCEYEDSGFSAKHIAWRQAVNEVAKVDGNTIFFKELIKSGDGAYCVTYEVKPDGKFRSSGFISKVEMTANKMRKNPEEPEDSGMGMAVGENGAPVGLLTQSLAAENATKIYLDYNMYNRNFHVEIPIKGGDTSEKN